MLVVFSSFFLLIKKGRLTYPPLHHYLYKILLTYKVERQSSTLQTYFYLENYPGPNIDTNPSEEFKHLRAFQKTFYSMILEHNFHNNK